jgi:target of rapamycin complex 2 subunit MAPKAP1
MDQARKRAAKIKVVKVDDSVLNTGDTDNKLFQRKSPTVEPPKASSLLSYQIEHCPKQPHNQFINYAKFDGTAQTGSIMFKVFLGINLGSAQRKNYPMPICVSSTAKISDFIGLICYKTSIAVSNSEQYLQNYENFGLFIAEENGEIELGFPSLDKRELCSRFCFTFLSLVECNPNEQQIDPSPSFSASEAENATTFLTEMKNQQQEDVVLLTGHITDIEAPLYKIYRVYIISRSL